MPVPNGNHAAPFQRAILFAGTPPAVVKYPPATMSPLGSMASAATNPLSPDRKVPEISGPDHCERSADYQSCRQRAIAVGVPCCHGGDWLVSHTRDAVARQPVRRALGVYEG